jgi:tetratricopeptide (TPR) repeat protein
VCFCASWSVTLSGQFGRQPWQENARDEFVQPDIMVFGQIVAGNAPLSTWTVELVAFKGVGVIRAALHWNGSFELRAVTPGEHRLRVLDARGEVLHEEIVSLRHEGEPLTVQVRRPESQGGSTETVSLQQLQHKPPRKALNAWKNGRAALDKQQFDRAVEHLKAAVATDPEFADAHNYLGAAYFHMKQYQESVAHFQQAVELAPTHPQASDNLCLVLIKSERYAEAGEAAGRILRQGGGSAMAHYAAAIGLISGAGSVVDVLNHLRRAEVSIPNARLLSAHVLEEAGRRGDAARAVEAYLRSPEADPKRTQLEAWLAQLKK